MQAGEKEQIKKGYKMPGVIGYFLLGLFMFSMPFIAHKPGSPIDRPTVLATLFIWLIAFYIFRRGYRRYKRIKVAQNAGTASLFGPRLAGHKRTPEEEALFLSLHHGAEAGIQALRVLPSVQSAENKEESIRKAVIEAMPALVDKALEDNLLTQKEEQAISELLEKTAASIDGKAREQLVKAGIIRDLLDGTVKPRINAPELPFNFQKSEKLIWVWPKLEVQENKSITEWKAGTRGISVRLAKGLYYRTGGARGRKVTKETVESLGTGPLALTSKHIYFQGAGLALRVPLKKIVSYQFCTDGVIVFRDGRAKPFTVLTDDSWFMINCFSNAQNWS
jgi:hypothetical protein